MKPEIIKTPWSYHVHVSKDSPKNINRGLSSFLESPDMEYWRGYYHPATYTALADAKKALAHFEKGFIEKRRHILSGCSSRSETVKIATV